MAETPYYRECMVGDRKIRILSLAGFNLIRSMVGLEEVGPYQWLAMKGEDRWAFRKETLERATPELIVELFGPAADPENHPIEE
jgi:hypothetical protein